MIPAQLSSSATYQDFKDPHVQLVIDRDAKGSKAILLAPMAQSTEMDNDGAGSPNPLHLAVYNAYVDDIGVLCLKVHKGRADNISLDTLIESAAIVTRELSNSETPNFRAIQFVDGSFRADAKVTESFKKTLKI